MRGMSRTHRPFTLLESLLLNPLVSVYALDCDVAVLSSCCKSPAGSRRCGSFKTASRPAEQQKSQTSPGSSVWSLDAEFSYSARTCACWSIRSMSSMADVTETQQPQTHHHNAHFWTGRVFFTWRLLGDARALVIHNTA